MKRSGLLAVAVGVQLLAGGWAVAQTGEPNASAARMRVDRLRAYLPHADGRGVRVGVVADSVNANSNLGTVAEDQSRGELPGNDRLLIVSDGPADSRDVGRAMLHHIYDIAPGVSLLGFATGTGGQESMAGAINALSATHAMDIIVDAHSYPDEPIYQDGVIAQAVIAHTDRGLHLSAAGDLGDWSVEQVWRDVDGNGYHEFNVHGVFNEDLPFDATFGANLNMFWSEGWGRAGRDFNMELYDNEGTLLAATSVDSSVTRIPYESLIYAPSRSGLQLRVKSTQGGPSGVRFKLIPTARLLTKNRNPFAVRELDFVGAGAITPHAGTLRSIAIASASYYRNDISSFYSSSGPFRRLFDINGNPDDQTFQKPDFIAPDSAYVPVGAFATDTGFDSTAAAAANAAGVAAIVLQLAGGPDSMTQAEFRQFLRTKTRSNPPLSHSRHVGFGFVDALGAGLAAAGPQPITQTLIPNHLGDVDRLVEAVGDSTLNVLRFPQAGGDFVTATISSREVDVSETFQGTYPVPMHLVYDEGTSPFKTLAYSDQDTDFTNQTIRYFSTSSSQLTTPLGQLVIASEEAFTINQFIHIAIDGPSFPYQTVMAEGEFGGFVSPAAPVVYYEVFLPVDAGPGFTVEVSSQDADIVLAAFAGRGGLIAESAGASLTAALPEFDEGFYLAVAGRNLESYGNFTVRMSYQRVPGLPRGGVEFPAVSTEFIPNPVTGLATFFGRLGPGLDRDVWAVRTGGGPLTAAVTGAFPSTALLGVGLYNDGQTLIAAGGPSQLPSATVNTEAGRLYLVAGAHGEGEVATDYDVAVAVTPPAAIDVALLPDREQGEYFRGLYNGSLRGPGDVATFRFTNPPLGTGSVYIAADNRDFVGTQFNPAFQVFDAAGVPIEGLIDSQGPVTGESFTYTLTPGARYYVQIFGSPSPNSYVGDATGFGDFRLDVRAYTTGIVAEAEEPNNLIDQALDISGIPSTWSDTKFPNFILTDVDFFRIRVAEGQDSLLILLRLPPPAKGPASERPAFNLRDREGVLLGTSEDNGVEQALFISRTLLPDDYFIEVPGDNTGTVYQLLWEGSTAPSLSPDAWVLF